MHERQVQLYDTTLRDGMQQEGMSVSVEEKVRIALKLDELGIHFIEGGFPSSNPKEVEFFRRMERERLETARLVAFGMTRRKGVAADQDEALRVLADVFAGTVAVVGKTWGLHLSKVLRVSHAENLRMIEDSVEFLVAQGKRVVYDAEHFFDAWRDDAALRAAVRAHGSRGRRRGRLSVRHQRRLAAAVRRRRGRRGGGGTCRCRWACTSTTTASARSPTASWPSTAAPCRCRAP